MKAVKVSVVIDDRLFREIESLCPARKTRLREGVRSATDGSGLLDGAVREYLTGPKRLHRHEPHVPHRIALYMDRDSHWKAKTIAYNQQVSLSALLANVIASRFTPRQQAA